MLRSLHDLEDYVIGATDGRIGHVKDLFFDDEAWVIRFLVVHTGAWLAGRTVLISPMAIGRPDWASRLLPVSITREQVRNSPDVDTQRPVSRQQEMQTLSHYGYCDYWRGTGIWGVGCYPNLVVNGIPDAEAAAVGADASWNGGQDPHLRSGKAVTGYRIEATDGDIGHVQGLLVDERTWAVRFLVVETNHWWADHRVLVSPEWIEALRWEDEVVTLGLTRQDVRDSPAYDAASSSSRAEETGVYQQGNAVGVSSIDAARAQDAPHSL